MTSGKNDDEYLLTGFRLGDPVVFKFIYRLYWQKLYNMAFYYVRNTADAEDIVQDVFISLWSRREHIDIKVALENYLVRSAKYTSFFYLKIKHKQTSLSKNIVVEHAVNNTEEHIQYKSLLDQVNAIFELASQKTREIFYLSRFNGLTYPEIATQLDCSVKTVEYHISIALKRLSRERFQ